MNRLALAAALTLAAVPALAVAQAAQPAAGAFSDARAALLFRLASLKADQLYLRELATYQQSLLEAARADPRAVLTNGRRARATCETTPIAALCGLVPNTFAPDSPKP
jgi:hypothetical protein